MKTIKEIFASLPSDQKTDASVAEFLKAIQTNLTQADVSANKSLTTMFFLAVAIELLNRAAVGELAFLGIKITDLALVRKILPIGLAYLFYTSLSFFAARRLLVECQSYAVSRTHPEISKSGLIRAMGPLSSMQTVAMIEALSDGWIQRAIMILSAPLIIAIVIGPFAFLIYSYWLAFSKFGGFDLVLWTSVILSMLFMAKGILLMVGTDSLAPPEA